MPTLILQPDESSAVDAFIGSSASHQNTNFGLWEEIRVGTEDVGKGLQSIWRTLMRVDLSSLIGTTIDDATLTFTNKSTPAVNDTFSVYRITQTNWTELGATWNKFDGVNNWTTAGGDYDSGTVWDSTFINSATDLVFDGLGSMVQDAIDNRSGILDLLIRGTATTGTNVYGGASSSDATPSNRPEFVINYTLPAFHFEATGGLSVNSTSDATYAITPPLPIEDALYFFLTSKVGVEVYPLHLPQNPKATIFPCVSYNLVTSGDEYDLAGPFDYVHPRFNLHVWANTYNEVKTVSQTIKDGINNFTGWWKSTEIMHVAIRNLGDLPVERSSDGSNKVIFHRVLDCEIWHRTENSA